MRLLLGLLVVLVAWATAQRLSDVPLADQKAIQTLILNQIEAFRQGDGEKAFSFAAPGIRQIFQTPQQFMQMVQSGYPQIYTARTVEFGKASRVMGQPQVWQVVLLVGVDGRRAVANYLLERQSDGQWKIAGVELGAAPPPPNAQLQPKEPNIVTRGRG